MHRWRPRRSSPVPHRHRACCRRTPSAATLWNPRPSPAAAWTGPEGAPAVPVRPWGGAAEPPVGLRGSSPARSGARRPVRSGRSGGWCLKLRLGNLHQLDEHAVSLAGVNKGLLPPALRDDVDRLDAVASKIFQPRLDVLHAEREVMDALSSTLKEPLQEAALAQRLHQLDLHAVRIAELRKAEALFGHIPPGHRLATQDVAEEHSALIDLMHPNRDVVEALRETHFVLTSLLN